MRAEYSGPWSFAVPQFIAFVVSMLMSLSIANALHNNSGARHIRFHMPRASTAAPAGVSGGGPVGVGPIVIPSPTPGNVGK
jgi:hypothetical protein